MRILIVSFYAEQHYSSTAQNTRLLARALLDEGHEVRVVCAGAEQGSVVEDGYLCIRLAVNSSGSRTGRFRAWLTDPMIRQNAEEILAVWCPDVIYMGAWKYLSDFAFVGREHGIPVVQMVHDYSILCLRTWLVDSWGNLCEGPTTHQKCLSCIWHSWTWKGRIKNLLLSSFRTLLHGGLSPSFTLGAQRALNDLQRYREAITLYIAQSPSVVDLLQSGGIERSRCRLLPQYIGEEKLREYPRAHGVPGRDRPLRLAFVGRWSWEKGVDLLLEAFLSAQVSQRVELWIISKNARRESIEAVVSQRLTPNKTISVFNDLQGIELSKKLALSDVCIVPSHMEVASRVVLEANAQGVPVIASDTVGNRYVIEDGVNGKVFRSLDVDDLARAITMISDNPAILTEWSDRVSKPVGRAEWVSMVSSIFYEAACRTDLETSR